MMGDFRRSRASAMAVLVSASLWIIALPGTSSGQVSIARPNFGVSEFAQTGATFRVEVKASSGLATSLWTAVLINDLRSWTGTVEQAEYGTYVDNNTVAGYRLTVRVPADVSPEVFKLVVSHPNGGAATNRNAVSIVQNLETNFYILHYTDVQVTAMEPTNPDTGEANLNGDIKGSIREIYWHAPAVNLINPRFMFHTGDEKENNWGGESNYELYIEASCKMLTPAFVSRGNNDSTTTTDVWRRQFGVETYSYKMGSFYIFMKDYRENNFSPWFSNEYAASFSDSTIKYRLFGQHYNSGANQWMPPVGQYPDLMLVGHGHVNSTLQTSPYYILETQAAYVRGAVGFFQFNKSADDWTCTTLGDPWFQLMSYGATAKINNTLSYANDGTQTTNTATIINNIAKNFFDGRVRFLMRHSALGYQVTGGEKLAEYSYNGGTNRAVLVKVNIAASATTVVSVSRIDADEDGMADDWERACFGNLTTADATTDSDGDNMLDRHEYLAGTAPTNRQSVLMLAQPVFSAGGTQIEIPWTSASNKSYALMQSTNLTFGFSIPVQVHIPATPPMNIWTTTVPASVAGMFFRVELE